MAKVLVVDDDPYMRDAYKAVLEKAGYELRTANDGVDALRILADWRPNIILLDLIMPRKDGFATLEEIKAAEALKRISVLVVSNLGHTRDRDRALALGASGYVVKSAAGPSDIVARIKSIIG